MHLNVITKLQITALKETTYFWLLESEGVTKIEGEIITIPDSHFLVVDLSLQ